MDGDDLTVTHQSTTKLIEKGGTLGFGVLLSLPEKIRGYQNGHRS